MLDMQVAKVLDLICTLMLEQLGWEGRDRFVQRTQGNEGMLRQDLLPTEVS
jgi:hypothetical protein